MGSEQDIHNGVNQNLTPCLGNIYLIGPMGAGKTTIGKLLASEMKLAMVDTDQEIEKKAGASISWIFDVEGEAGFRQREARALQEISCQQPKKVVATGGGIVLSEDNRLILKSTGICVYLLANPDYLLARIGKDKKRPLLLAPEGAESVLHRIVQERDPLYREVAVLVVQTNARPPKQLAKDIAKKIRQKMACL